MPVSGGERSNGGAGLPPEDETRAEDTPPAGAMGVEDAPPAGDVRVEGAITPLTIAVDGPAASGKSTISRAVAAELGLLYLDTGAMYRAVTWLALQKGLDPADEAAITALATNAAFTLPELGQTESVNPPILIDGQDATTGLREPAVDAAVSLVSSYAGVRAALVAAQRQIARARGVVMVGRDIGTVVLPAARLKVYLEASAEERARRRYEERVAQGKVADFEQIQLAMQERDRLDAQRAHAPMRPAADAVVLDSTGLSIQQVVDRVTALARAAETQPI